MTDHDHDDDVPQVFIGITDMTEDDMQRLFDTAMEYTAVNGGTDVQKLAKDAWAFLSQCLVSTGGDVNISLAMTNQFLWLAADSMLLHREE